MKKTSRRKFGKQLTGALAALPVVAAIDVLGQRPKAQRTQKIEFFKEHDTPPPVLLAEGSLTVETTHAFGNAVGQGGGRKKHFVSDYEGLTIAHIKISDGSGEMLYRNDKPRDSEVRIQVSDGSEAKVGRNADGFYVDLPDDKDLGNAQNVANRKRGKRYRPKKGNDELIFEAITVAQTSAANSPFLFRITKNDLNSKLEEARVMIWLED